MSTALIIPFGAADTENGRIRQGIWNRVRPLWEGETAAEKVHIPHPHTLIVASDPLFGQQDHEIVEGYPMPVSPPRPFSVARAVNNAVRLAPPEVDKFVTIGADALPDWRVVDWASAELDTRPWTRLFGKGGTLPEGATTWHEPDIRPFETPCVGPIAFTRTAFMAVRGYDERFEGWGYEDVDLWERLRQAFPQPGREDRVPPYPLVQFAHPTDHHDLTDANPNVRLWAWKQDRAMRQGRRRNDHLADCLFRSAE